MPEVNETPKTITVDKPETTALAKVKRGEIARPASFAPTSFDQAMQFAEMIAKSDFAPKDMKGRPGNVLIAMQMGSEVGLSPMQALQNIAVINGRPSLWGDSALAVVQANAAYEWHKEWFEGDGDNLTAVFQIKRRGSDVYESRFSVADAKRAGLWDERAQVMRDGQQRRNDSPWYKYPKRMLQMRARGFGLRDKFADALRGLNIAEEIMDYVQPEAPAEVPTVQVLQPETVVEDAEQKAAEEAQKLLTSMGFNSAKVVVWLQQNKGHLADKLPALREEAKRGNHGTSTQSETKVQGKSVEADQPPAQTVDPAQTRTSPVEDPLTITAQDAPPPKSQPAKKASTRSLF